MDTDRPKRNVSLEDLLFLYNLTFLTNPEDITPTIVVEVKSVPQMSSHKVPEIEGDYHHVHDEDAGDRTDDASLTQLTEEGLKSPMVIAERRSFTNYTGLHGGKQSDNYAVNLHTIRSPSRTVLIIKQNVRILIPCLLHQLSQPREVH